MRLDVLVFGDVLMGGCQMYSLLSTSHLPTDTYTTHLAMFRMAPMQVLASLCA